MTPMAFKVAKQLIDGATIDRNDVMTAGVEDILFLLEQRVRDIKVVIKQLKKEA